VASGGDDTTGPGPEWADLERSISGDLVLPGTPAYEELPRPFNARFHDVRPRAVVRCTSPIDVAAAIAFARRHGLELAARSGGHCFAGRSTSPGLVVDVGPMDSVSVEAGVATVGAGVRLGHVYDSLQEHRLAIPAGTCPTVGVAGLTLGGGLGILGRRYGVTSDSLVAARIVLADGRILECDDDRHSDLFWALRGAGAGNFGVVTSLSFQTVPAPEMTNFHAAWPFGAAAAVIDAWQRWAPDGPDELAVSLKVTTGPDVDRPPSVDVYGGLLGADADAAAALDALLVRAGVEPESTWSGHMSFPDARTWWSELGAHGAQGGGHAPPPEHPVMYARSEFFGRPLAREAIDALLEAFAGRRAAGQARELDFMPWGGAYNRVPPEATAFVHRAERFQLKHSAVVDVASSKEQRDAASAWVGRSWETVRPSGSGRVFQNFPDPDLANWAEAYYGGNLQRLVAVKARYDPAGVFRFDQSLPLRG